MTPLEMIVTSSVSVLVGGMIPIALFYLTEQIARRQRINDWFEKTYIEEGIDPLHNCFCGWALISSRPTRSVQESLKNPMLDELPINAASKLIAMTGSMSFQNWLNAMRSLRLRAIGHGDYNGWAKFQSHAATIAGHLDTLRNELLSQALKEKSDVFEFRKLACIEKFNDALKQMSDDLVDDPNVTSYSAQPDGESSEKICRDVAGKETFKWQLGYRDR